MLKDKLSVALTIVGMCAAAVIVTVIFIAVMLYACGGVTGLFVILTGIYAILMSGTIDWLEKKLYEDGE